MDRPKNSKDNTAANRRRPGDLLKKITSHFSKSNSPQNTSPTENEKKLDPDLALKSSDVGIWSWDIINNHVTWDKQTYGLFQRTPENFTGTYDALISLIHPEDQVQFNQTVQEAVNNKSEFEVHFRIIYPDKTTHYLVGRGKVYLTSSGEPSYMTGACWDMTQQRETELNLQHAKEEAEEASKQKSRFMAKISHDLRSPLNGIIGFAELMYHGKVGPVSIDHKEYLGDILSSARQLLLLINDVLDLSKIEAGKMEFHPENIDLTRILDETKDIFQTLIMTKHIQFTTEIDKNLKKIFIDPARLKQVLYNFVSNALKCTNDNGKVSVHVLHNDHETFRLEVQDTGIGIRKEDLNRLFVEFQQLDITIARKYPSSGLGLALTKHIVEAQGGSVGVDSTFGHGSTFFAILPYTQKEISQDGNSSDSKKQQAN